jgi:ABC-type branched-subunit amino acid transport system ATPase component
MSTVDDRADIALELSKVTLRFSGLVAVNNVSLQVAAGCLLGVIGANGAGKTSLLNCVSGHYRATSGTIRLHGDVISGLSPSRLSKLGLVRTFQNPLVLRHATVRENLMLGLDLVRRSKLRDAASPRSTREVRAEVDRVAERLGMTGLLDREAGDLPVGLLKLLEIGRGVAARPRLLLLDEPTAGMNATEREFAGDLLREVIRSQSVTVLLVEHDVEFVAGLCDRMVAFEFGALIADGAPGDVLRSERVIAGYLGEEFASALSAGVGREEKA